MEGKVTETELGKGAYEHIYPADSPDHGPNFAIGPVPDCLIDYPGLKVTAANGCNVALALWAKVLCFHFYNGQSIDWIKSFRNVTGVSLQDAKTAWDCLPKFDKDALEAARKELKRMEILKHDFYTDLLNAREEIKELKSILRRYL